VFHRVGIPGSGGSDYLRPDWEYVLCLKRPGALPWSDNTAMGHPPRWSPGGEMYKGRQDGKRACKHSKRLADGTIKVECYDAPAIANPGNVLTGAWDLADLNGMLDAYEAGGVRSGKRNRKFRPSHRQIIERHRDGTVFVQNYDDPAIANPGNVLTGPWDLAGLNGMLDAYEAGDVRSGLAAHGFIGSPLAHDNEAPFPEWLAEFFIRTFCPEGGIVLDPFCGSGTTLAVAQKWGRHSIGIDLRRSQVELSKARCAQKTLV